MSLKRKAALALIVACYLVGSAVTVQGAGEANSPEVELAPDVQQAIGVRVEQVRRQSLGENLSVNGRIEAITGATAQINAPLAGRVLKLLANRGQPVRAGQDLVLLDSPEIRQLVVESERAQAQAGAGLAQAQARLELAKQTYEREKELVSLKISARKDAQVAEAELRTAQADLQVARSQLALSGAQLKNRLAQLGQGGARTRADGSVVLVSPLNGTVAEQQVTAGESVEAGRLLFRIVDLSRLWATAEVYEKDLARVRVGLPVLVTTPSYPNRELRGRIANIDPVLDPETRTLGVRAVVDNPGDRLKPGMFASLRFATENSPRLGLAIPRSAVLDADGRQLVYLQKGDGRFTPVEVSLGASINERVEVTAGLQEGQKIVITGAFQVRAQALKGESQTQDEDAPRKPSGSTAVAATPPWGWIAGAVALAVCSFAAGVIIAKRGDSRSRSRTDSDFRPKL